MLRLCYRQHAGEMRSDAAEAWSGQAWSDADNDQQFSSTAEDVPWYWRQINPGVSPFCQYHVRLFYSSSKLHTLSHSQFFLFQQLSYVYCV